jgi:sterol desaturase/sphingolipid hydroxylase (fatty acid hydroxylase superfamily)
MSTSQGLATASDTTRGRIQQLQRECNSCNSDHNSVEGGTMLESAASTIGAIIAAMAAVAVVETLIPLHARGPCHRTHLGPNVALTFITFATNLVINGVLVATLARLEASGAGLLQALALPRAASVAVVVVVLDFSFWVAHVAMHHVPAVWRFHRVHHSDPAVDVTTTIRQHPGEGVIRYGFLGVFACALGADPVAFAVYRTASALNGLLEHANIRLPRRLDDALALVTTWPNLHKVHHSRTATETNTNYGNLFSLFDRLLGTFTPAARGATVRYGLDGLDDVATQTTCGLLALPFRSDAPTGAVASSRARVSSAGGSPAP